MHSLIELLSLVEPYYVILVAAVGLVGNSLSFSLFAFTRLRKKEVHAVLAVLALVDNGFLLVLVLVTLRHFGLNLVDAYSLVCKLSVFLPYLFGFLSIWLIVLFSIERFIVVYFPLRRYVLYSPKRNRRLMLALLLFALAFYSFGLWTTDLGSLQQLPATAARSNSTQVRTCLTIEKWLSLLNAMVIFDTVFTMALPFILILVLNALIVIRLTRGSHLLVSTSPTPGSRQYRRQFAAASSGFSTGATDTDASFFESSVVLASSKPSSLRRQRSEDPSEFKVKFKGAGAGVRGVKKQVSLDEDSVSVVEINRRAAAASASSNSSRPPRYSSLSSGFSKRPRVVRLSSAYVGGQRRYSKTTRMLLIISTAFLVLHGPTALLKTWYILTHYTESAPTAGGGARPLEELLERVTCYIYYLHYSLNFFLYVFNIRVFRQFLTRKLSARTKERPVLR